MQQVLGMSGILKLSDGKPSLQLGENTTTEQIEEVLNFYNEDGERDCLRLNMSQPEKIIIEFSESDPIDPRSVALDLREEGADIKINPTILTSLKKEGLIQTSPFIRRQKPTNWELGNCLHIHS